MSTLPLIAPSAASTAFVDAVCAPALHAGVVCPGPTVADAGVNDPVLARGDEKKVVDRIIKVVVIAMVDVLVRSELPADDALHDDAMLVFPSTTLCDLNLPIKKTVLGPVYPARADEDPGIFSYRLGPLRNGLRRRQAFAGVAPSSKPVGAAIFASDSRHVNAADAARFGCYLFHSTHIMPTG